MRSRPFRALIVLVALLMPAAASAYASSTTTPARQLTRIRFAAEKAGPHRASSRHRRRRHHARAKRSSARIDNRTRGGSRAGSGTPQPLGVTGQWSLSFDDEFNGGSLDLNNWNPNWFGTSTTLPSDPVGSSEQDCPSPSQLSEGAGDLSLGVAAGPCTTDNGKVYPYSGSLINTYGKFTFTYGFLEARVYVPSTSDGQLVNTLSFWADGTGNWPQTGELDVMEVLSGCGPNGSAGLAYHFHSDAGSPGACVPMSNPSGWHTFGADWQPGSVTYYYDGKTVGEIRSGITGSPMFLVLGQGVNPNTGGPTMAPSSALVDYVRVWHAA
jgi:beta-glucanase (GH16 family)